MEDFKEGGLPVCEHDEFCGGCIYQGVPYSEQLAIKEGEVKELFSEKRIRPKTFDPIEGCPDQYRYRNKMEYTFGDMVKDGPMVPWHAQEAELHVHHHRGSVPAGGRGF